MFGSLGFPELIFIFLLALLIFGPKKLPELGRTLGKAMAEFRKATTDLKRTINAELIEQELREADPRKMVRDSLREAKASLESAVRQDDAKAAAAAAPAVIAPAAAAPDVAAPEPAAAAEDEPDPTEPPARPDPARPAAAGHAGPVEYGPPGAIARGAACEDPGDDAPAGAGPADEEAMDAAREPNAPQPATSS